jgi:hypothetical protein
VNLQQHLDLDCFLVVVYDDAVVAPSLAHGSPGRRDPGQRGRRRWTAKLWSGVSLDGGG